MTDEAPAELRRRVPPALVAATLLLLAVAALILLSWFGVGPFGSLGVFILSNVAGFFALLVLGVLGGAFVGMLVAHRMFSNQEFTPFERTMMQSVNDLKTSVDALRDQHEEILERVHAAERAREGREAPLKRDRS